jgi:putative thiamine transport system substrate-binding protein
MSSRLTNRAARDPHPAMHRRTLLAGLCAALVTPAAAGLNMARLRASARGKTVRFNAWAGDEAINRYIAWAGRELAQRFGVRLQHVKVADIAETVARLRAEKAAGRSSGGGADLLWINGENFAALRRENLLHGPWADDIPNARLIDETDPTTRRDFTIPTAGYELAWGTSRFTLFHDQKRVPSPPRDPAALAQWVKANPGRFTYPQPPNFLGASFLKQVLLVMTRDRRVFSSGPSAAVFLETTRPLFAWLRDIRPALWRSGKIHPVSGPAQRQLLGLGEVDWAMSFNPGEAQSAIRRGELPPGIGATHFSGGVLANSHFLAIPANSSAKDAAIVAADFLVSPLAQARKADPAFWGDPSVLRLDRLTAAERKAFANATPLPRGPILEEPAPAWTTMLERAWAEAFAAG